MTSAEQPAMNSGGQTGCNHIHPAATVAQGCEIAGSVMHEHARLKKNAELRDSVLGAYSYLSAGSMAVAADIGRFTSVGPGAYIGLWEHDTFTTTHTFYLYESSGGFCKGWRNFSRDSIRTVIGSDVWIGANAVIRKGVTVGHGAVIGASAVVTRDVPPFAVVTGVPAHVHRYRFDAATRSLLLRTRWWDLPRETIQDMVDKEVWYDINDLVAYLRTLPDMQAEQMDGQAAGQMDGQAETPQDRQAPQQKHRSRK
ncbi:CatB-related O-acetyltransferase [Oleidesulfovibrio alaskensis]|uniref:CatB-related O-acetyltransferase n=1 Tax=Oleidesulfovibrio alaskensis TaxID=58180 RepID=UPI00042A6DBB|nr:CatB-related O-acetyltransferase [Oleidesulfovibrio alaskensis]